jgi:ribose 5-phosphate isomerase A
MDKQQELKIEAAKAAIKYIVDDEIIGIGTGSTVNCFIDLLVDHKHRIKAAVSSSVASTEKLKSIGIDVIDLNDAAEIPVYIDGADESNHQLELIKGGGAALSREKIIAAVADKFVCIADESNANRSSAYGTKSRCQRISKARWRSGVSTWRYH